MRRAADILAATMIIVIMKPIAAQPGPDASPGQSDIVTKMQSFHEKTTDYKARFSQEVRTKSPKRTFTRSGTVYFKKPGMMRWDYKVPDEVYYVSDGEVLWSYDVAEAIAYRLKVKDSELFWALRFLTGAARIPAEFDVTEDKPASSGLVPVTMKPRTSHSGVQSITLFVDPKTGEARESEVVDPLGNVSHVKFEDPVLTPLPKDGFTFKVPDGVRVQDVGPK